MNCGAFLLDFIFALRQESYFLQAETQKIAPRMEEDMLETLRANIEAMKNSELEIDKLSAQKVEILERICSPCLLSLGFHGFFKTFY